MRPLDRIIVHHTAGTHGTAASIRHHHVERRGWTDIGYHFLIRNGWVKANAFDPDSDGRVDLGRPVAEVGAHDLGENETSLGIALVGRDVVTWRQLAALHALVQGLRAGLREPLQVYGHCEHEPAGTPTECPGARLRPRLAWLREWLASPRPDRASAELAAVLMPRLPSVSG